jgi:hypothetical protein
MPVPCLASSSTLKVTCSSEASVQFNRTTRRYIPEDRTLHRHRWQNLKSIVFFVIFQTSLHLYINLLQLHIYCCKANQETDTTLRSLLNYYHHDQRHNNFAM